MRAELVTAFLLIATPVAAQRGAVTGVRSSAQDGGGPAVVTVTGTNPCGAVRIDYGDGQVITHPITGMPATLEHAYERPGTYRLSVEGMGNCDGRVQGTARAVGALAVDRETSDRGQAPVQARFRGLDRNGDGVITRSEWRGNNQSFDQHDWDNDGVLSGDEIRSDAAGRGERRGEIVDRADFSDWTEAQFRRLDTNGDSRIARDEWRYDPELFRRADANGDGRLNLSEFLGDVGDAGADRDRDRFDDDRSGRFDRLDTNADGIISRGEWRGQADAFADRDANRDGVITRPEFATDRDGAAGGRTVSVSATVRWTRTGLVVRRGDLVRFEADGTIELSRGSRDVADPRGARSGRVADNAPLPDAAAGSLIARVADSAPFLVGGEGSMRMPRDGEILLGVNDDYLDDNRGEFMVTVRVTR